MGIKKRILIAIFLIGTLSFFSSCNYLDSEWRAENRKVNEQALQVSKEDLVTATKELIDSQSIDNLESYEVEIYVHNVNRNWGEVETLEGFIEKANPRVEITAHFGEGYSAEEYAVQIIDFMKILTKLDAKKELASWITDVKQIDITMFRNEWQTPNNNRLYSMTDSVKRAFWWNYMVLVSTPMSDIGKSSPTIRKSDYWCENSDEQDYIWNIGETVESYIKRNNISANISTQFNDGFSPEEYVEATDLIFSTLESVPMEKKLTTYIFYEDTETRYKIGEFESYEDYAQKTAEEIAEDYRVAIEAYGKEADSAI